MLVVNPNNPTGSFVSQDELDRLAACCAQLDVALIADEVFADYELEPGAAGRAAPVLTRDDVLVFALGGLSKSIGLPQVKLGWIAVAGPDAIGRRGAAASRIDLRHLPVGVHAGAAGRRRAARPRRRHPRANQRADHRQLSAAEGPGRRPCRRVAS